VEGSLTDREDGSSIEGALVLLVDADGQAMTGRLSDESGYFLLPVPEPGSYRLRAVRIGYATLLSDPFSVVEGDTAVVHLVASKEAIPLGGIEVEVVQRCRVRPEGGLAVVRVWEAVRKALTIQVWTDLEGLFRFEVSVFTRDLELGTRQIRSEDRSETEILDRVPMQSLPAETLVEEGFVREVGSDSIEYLAPDAQVLLSNAFLNTHCLELTADPATPSLIGLGFAPQTDGEVPDVVGTLWVDRDTGELRFLEYRYTWVPFGQGLEQAGGRLEFEVLPSGAWIVRRWRILMPTVQRTGVNSARLVGFKEAGAQVISVSPVIR